jgi:septum formation protein
MLYLASQSPRRAELLRQLDLKFEILDIAVDESVLVGESAGQLVKRLAVEKALAGLATLTDVQPGDLVLAADTLIALDDEIIGKPASVDDCEQILQRLAGRQHEVLSAVALAGHQGVLGSRLSVNRVRFGQLEMDRIRQYCVSGEPMDKAGAYAIQGLAAIFIQHITGSYSAIMGLPLFETAELLKQAGHHPLDNNDD